MILSSYPTIDLHGCDRDYAVYLVKDFINDNYKLQKTYYRYNSWHRKWHLKKCRS